MEVDEEINSKKKLGQRKKDLQKQLREIEKFTDIQNVLKETWQQELQDIEQRRNDLLPELQKCRKITKNCKVCKTERISARGIWPNGLGTVTRPAIKSKKDLSNQKIEKVSGASAELDEEHRILQARDERRIGCASHSNGGCFDPAVKEHFITMAWQQLALFRVKSAEYLAASTSHRQPLRCTCQREEKEETKMRRSREESTSAGEP